jgi:hypothetical protein
MLESPVVPVTNAPGEKLAVDATVTLDTAVTTYDSIKHPITDTESPLTLPANTKRFLLRANTKKVTVGFSANDPDAFTLNPGSVFDSWDTKRSSPLTIYLTASQPTDTVTVILGS